MSDQNSTPAGVPANTAGAAPTDTSRVPRGVPTGGQFAASTKAEAGVNLGEGRPNPNWGGMPDPVQQTGDRPNPNHPWSSPADPITSVNLVSNRNWIASMPFDVRVALASIEDTGAAVNEFEPGAIFYEAEVDFVGTSRNLGAVIANTCDAIESYCGRYDSRDPNEGIGMSEDVSTVLSFIRTDTLRGSYDEGLARLMRWVGTDTSRFDDED